MYSLLITINNPKADGPVTLNIFGKSVDFDYMARGRLRKLTGVLETTSSISKDGIEKIKDLLKEHGTSVEIKYKEDPVIAKASRNIERMLSGIGEKMNKKSMRAKSAREKTMTRKQAAKAMKSLVTMPEADMSMVVAQLPKSVQRAVAAQSIKRGRTFSSRSRSAFGSNRTMRRRQEKKNIRAMRKREALVAIAEENERERSA